MRVGVKLFASLARYAPGGRAGQLMELDLPEGATLAELVRSLGLRPDEAKLMFVNGCAHEPDWRLQPGDQVGIFPKVGGG